MVRKKCSQEVSVFLLLSPWPIDGVILQENLTAHLIMPQRAGPLPTCPLNMQKSRFYIAQINIGANVTLLTWKLIFLMCITGCLLGYTFYIAYIHYIILHIFLGEISQFWYHIYCAAQWGEIWSLCLRKNQNQSWTNGLFGLIVLQYIKWSRRTVLLPLALCWFWHAGEQQTFQWDFRKLQTMHERDYYTGGLGTSSLPVQWLDKKTDLNGEGFGSYRKLCYWPLCFVSALCSPLLQQWLLSLLLNLFGPEGLWTVEVTLSCVKM